MPSRSEGFPIDRQKFVGIMTTGDFVVVRNGWGQYSIWPYRKAIPSGWSVQSCARSREACLAYVRDNWLKPTLASAHRAAPAIPRSWSAVHEERGTDSFNCRIVDDSEASSSIGVAAEFSPMHCVHELFERWVNRQPQAPAVTQGQLSLSYEDLEKRSNQLAHYLRDLGATSDCLITVCLDASVDLVVTLMAILKAGSAYLPIDPAFPPARIEHIVKDSGSRIVVTTSRYATLLGDRCQMIRLDSDRELLVTLPLARLPAVATSQHLAYCMYTSGSTGNPKGVLISHESIVNLLGDWNRRLPVGRHDCFAFWTSYVFDVSVWELLLPLTSGASLAVAPERIRLDPARQLAWAAEAGVSTAYIPPHLARQLPELISTGDQLPQKLLFGVEPLSTLVLACLPTGTRMCNGYGPTETTVYSTLCMEIPRNADGIVPIGRPIANTQVHVLDSDLMPVPIGISGELYIGGVGLARGYLNRPALTAERFIPNPFGEPGSRLYRTGDSVKLLPDGQLLFLGRDDGQVKIRGVRVEIGEVEAVLMSHSAVREAVAIAQGDATTGKRLWVFVVPRPNAAVTVEDLRQWVKDRLPRAYIPASWKLLQSVPRTSNGKVDRQILIETHMTSTKVAATTQASLEATLLIIWAELLGRRDVRIQDDFFDLDGDLQFAIDAIDQIGERLGYHVSLEKFFELRTISRLASFIGTPVGTVASNATPLIAINSAAPCALYVVPGLGLNSNWFFPLARKLSGQVQVLCFEPGAAQTGAHQTSIAAIAADYARSIEERTSTRAVTIAGHSYGGAVAFETARVLQRNGRDVDLWLLDSSLVAAGSKVKPLAMEADLQRFSLLRWRRALPSMEGLAARQIRGYVAYEPSGTFGGRVVAVLAEQGLAAGGLLQVKQDALKRWVGEPVKWIDVPGSHFSLLAPENVSHLATAMTNEFQMKLESAA